MPCRTTILIAVFAVGCDGAMAERPPGADAGPESSDPGPAGAFDAGPGVPPGADAGPPGADAGPRAAPPPPAPPPPVDCSALRGADRMLCAETARTCEVLFTGGQGCDAVCAAAGLVCAESYEDVDGCGRGASLGCADTGHRSDVCVCEAEDTGPCVPDTCASAGFECGAGLPDGCGGTIDCPGTCADGLPCTGGRCTPAAPTGRCTSSDCPAFPGAEGEGMYARGGRGGGVYHVTTLANSGSGSFREGVSGSGARTIVFDVGGIIDLTGTLTISRDDLTVAGQTAPGDGITFRGYDVIVDANDVILQHVRFRAGDIRKKRSRSGGGFTEDSLTLSGRDIIVDHVSASWGIDETLSASSRGWDDITVQYSIISEGLHRTSLFHGEYDPGHEGHSKGGLFKIRGGEASVTIHHNIYASNDNRNPSIGGYGSGDRLWADIRNNIVYNHDSCGYTSGQNEWLRVNYVGNYVMFGPTTPDPGFFTSRLPHMPLETQAPNHVSLHHADNLLDRDRNGIFDGVEEAASSMFGRDFTARSTPWEMRRVTTQPNAVARELVLAGAGARPWRRDAVDARIVSEVRSAGRMGRLIDSQEQVGGWPAHDRGTPSRDSDRDGMPDAWERMAGTDPDRADGGGDRDGDGYTNLENYLHHASAFGPTP